MLTHTPSSEPNGASYADSPLNRALDAVLVDTTDLTPAEVVDRMASLVESRRRLSPTRFRLWRA
jgi:hypothetical protein